MNNLKKFFGFALAAALFLSLSAGAEPSYHYRKQPPYYEEEEFDGQAYYASRYVPALRPQVMIGTLIVVSVIVVLLQNTSNSNHSHT